ncbi:MAG: ABC transporter permease [Candidatus Eremiobacteraeota bacterium]|jgi:Cu-processing system permease protein|nr:ABC transporter permease [Candidatus Eremiobacteraeota bacterium]MCL5055359.1 ABC transporter permease [Bacillota bacterium]
MLEILKNNFRDILKGKWLLVYPLFFVFASIGFFELTSTPSKNLVSLLNLIVIFLPLISLMFGTFYFYNSRKFMELLLTNPVSRKAVFWGNYLGVSFSLCAGFILGLAPAIILYLIRSPQEIPILLIMVLSGTLLTFSFTAFAVLITTLFEDRSKGFGFSVLIWLYVSLIHDGIILTVTVLFSRYPVGRIVMALSFLNPVGLARILILLRLDISAVMGYTGAVLEEFFGKSEGMIMAASGLVLWILLPLLLSQVLFQKKDLG